MDDWPFVMQKVCSYTGKTPQQVLEMPETELRLTLAVIRASPPGGPRP